MRPYHLADEEVLHTNNMRALTPERARMIAELAARMLEEQEPKRPALVPIRHLALAR